MSNQVIYYLHCIRLNSLKDQKQPDHSKWCRTYGLNTQCDPQTRWCQNQRINLKIKYLMCFGFSFQTLKKPPRKAETQRTNLQVKSNLIPGRRHFKNHYPIENNCYLKNQKYFSHIPWQGYKQNIFLDHCQRHKNQWIITYQFFDSAHFKQHGNFRI